MPRNVTILGLFDEPAEGPAPAPQALERLRGLGLSSEHMSVLTNVPVPARQLGTGLRSGWARWGLAPVALLGALGGLAIGLFFTAGTTLLYQVIQGRQPIVSAPPSLIIIFEMVMLGMMWATFGGFILINRLPVFGRPPYDTAITEGEVGVLVQVRPELAAETESVLRQAGAKAVERFEPERRRRLDTWSGAVLGLVAVATLVIGLVLLVSYDVIKIDFPTQMAEQLSTAPQAGPRLAAPPLAVPVEGPSLVDGQAGTQRLPSDANSLQRGRVLYDIDCALCHSAGGVGNGPIGGYFSKRPVAFTSDLMASMTDSHIFAVITQGYGSMPRLSENLMLDERWDVINYVRSLRK
jgi:mono/diheme cytochrome c family protein